jgi:hypothetical protein
MRSVKIKLEGYKTFCVSFVNPALNFFTRNSMSLGDGRPFAGQLAFIS